MKKLLILRHGKAENQFDSDYDRSLRHAGIEQVEHIGQTLLKKNLVPNLIITSSAIRAVQSAEIIYDVCLCKIIRKADNLYISVVEDMIDEIESVEDSIETLMLIGHNPTFEHFVHDFSDYKGGFGTSNCAVFSIDSDNWKNFEPGDNIKLEEILLPKGVI